MEKQQCKTEKERRQTAGRQLLERAGTGAQVDLLALDMCVHERVCTGTLRGLRRPQRWVGSTEEGSRKLKLPWASFPFLCKIMSNVTSSEQRRKLLVWCLQQEEEPQWAVRRTLSHTPSRTG